MSLKFLKKKSLLTIIGNSIKGGDNYFFRNMYAQNEKGEVVDILEDGKNSCAVFVSWILLALEMIKRPHATVEGTAKDLLASGWYEVKEPRPGAVLVWEKATGTHDELPHSHIGFYVGNYEAISNDSRGKGFPGKHPYDYKGTRKVEKIYWHPDLDKG